MELFKTDILKKEYKDFNKIYLPSVLECGFCNVVSCEFHSKFFVSCVHCRSRACKKCKMFNASKGMLLKSASPETVNYLYNYIVDFLNISDETLNKFCPEIKIEKMQKINFKTRVKSEKFSQKTVKVDLSTHLKNGQFQVGRWKRRFYY